MKSPSCIHTESEINQTDQLLSHTVEKGVIPHTPLLSVCVWAFIVLHPESDSPVLGLLCWWWVKLPVTKQMGSTWRAALSSCSALSQYDSALDDVHVHCWVCGPPFENPAFTLASLLPDDFAGSCRAQWSGPVLPVLTSCHMSPAPVLERDQIMTSVQLSPSAHHEFPYMVICRVINNLGFYIMVQF